MSDEILKNYSRRTPFDEAMNAIGTAQNDGFDPYFWIPRGAPMITVTQVPDMSKLPYTEMYGPVTCGTLEEAKRKAIFYGLSGYWYAGNHTLYLIPKETPDDNHPEGQLATALE